MSSFSPRLFVPVAVLLFVVAAVFKMPMMVSMRACYASTKLVRAVILSPREWTASVVFASRADSSATVYAAIVCGLGDRVRGCGVLVCDCAGVHYGSTGIELLLQ